jgi:hypothetical protein
MGILTALHDGNPVRNDSNLAFNTDEDMCAGKCTSRSYCRVICLEIQPQWTEIILPGRIRINLGLHHEPTSNILERARGALRAGQTV